MSSNKRTMTEFASLLNQTVIDIKKYLKKLFFFFAFICPHAWFLKIAISKEFLKSDVQKF